MMKNADLPAMPMFNVDAKPGMVRVKGGDKNDSVATAGLTKREMFAMHAMQGILSSLAKDEIGYNKWEERLAEHSVGLADALLAELEK